MRRNMLVALWGVIMALALTVVDNDDGTVTATITGHSGGDDVSWYTAKIDNDFSTPSSWTLKGASSPLTTAPVVFASTTITAGYGLYWSYAINSTTSEVTAPVFHSHHDADTALTKQCLDAVQTRILSLSLVSSSNVVVRKASWDRDVPKPGIIISPVREAMNPAAGTNERDDVGHGVQVVLVRSSNENLTLNLPTFTKWREQIRRAFHNQRLPGVSLVIRCSVEPGEPYQQNQFKQGVDASVLVVRCIAREPRGIS